MKVKKVVEVKTNYIFEAPIISAKISGRDPRFGTVNHTFDLNEYLLPDPKNIFLVRVSGESMIDQQIFEGDILVVDKSEEPEDGKIVIAALNGDMAVKIFRKINNKIYLFSANKKFLPIEIEGLMEFQIQGVVKHVIHTY